MDISFNDLKYLVTLVSDDLLNDDFSNFEVNDSHFSENRHEVSEEMYDKAYLLSRLLNELCKYRPLPF